MAEPGGVGTWHGLEVEQRRARRTLSAEERLRWLADALDVVASTGALDRDRRRRAAAAAVMASALGLEPEVSP